MQLPHLSVHIPKTGGSTFKDVLRTWCPERAVMDYDAGPLRRPGELGAAGRFRKLLRTWRVRRALRHHPERPYFLHGHFRATKYDDVFPGAPCLVWFRDPVQRLASHHAFWLRSPDPRNPLCRRLLRERWTLERFAAVPELRDVHARYLDGRAPAQLAFVGITEQYERSMTLFARLYFPEREGTAYRLRNTNVERQRQPYEFPRAVLAALRDANRLDLELYEQALRRFEELCARHGVAS